MASVTDIWNLALTRLDISQSIQSVDDQNAPAGVCKRFYDSCRKRTLEAAYWSFANVAQALAVELDQSTVQTQADTFYPGWRFVYAAPNDCLRAIAVTTQFGLRQNPWLNWWWQQSNLSLGAQSWGQFAPPFRMVENAAQNGRSILCDQDSAWLIYTRDVTNVSVYSEAFKSLLAWCLAIDIAGPVSANQNAKKLAMEGYKDELSVALAVDLNQERTDPYPDSRSITGRM